MGVYGNVENIYIYLGVYGYVENIYIYIYSCIYGKLDIYIILLRIIYKLLYITNNDLRINYSSFIFEYIYMYLLCCYYYVFIMHVRETH